MSKARRDGPNKHPFLRTLNVFWRGIDLTTLDYMDFSEKEIEKLNLLPGDLLVCEGGDIGRTALWRGELESCGYQNHLHRLRVKNNDVNPEFVAFWMQAAIKILGFYQDEGNKTTIPNLSQSRLKNFDIPLPPLPEQHAIATTLRTVQDAKEKADAVIAATKALKVAMMKHLFMYGPVPPEDADKVVLKETEIGQVPEEWEIRKIGDVLIFQPGYAFKSEDYVDSGVKLFKISNVSFGITNWKDVSYLPSSFYDEFKQYQLKIGDLVIAMTRPIVSGGIKISRISSNDCPSLLNQRVGRFIPKSTINLDFLYQSLFNNSFIDAIGDGAGGSQQPNISGKQIERIVIPVPPIEIQNHIAIILSAIDKKLAAEQSRKEALDSLFSSLLHDLMTAKIRVKNIV